MIITGHNYKKDNKKVTSLLRIKVREGISLDFLCRKVLTNGKKFIKIHL